MANENNNQNQPTGTKQNGDVLAQLAANRATVKDVYLLEKGMSTTLNKIEKNQEKANSVLSNLFTELKSGHKVMSSVDTKLQQIINKLSAGGSGTKGSSVLETTVLDIASYVNDCSSYLDEIRELLKNIDANTNNSNGLNPSNGSATQVDTLDDVNDTILDVLQEIQSFHYDVNEHNYQTEQDLSEIISILNNANLDKLGSAMETLGKSFRDTGGRRSSDRDNTGDSDEDNKKKHQMADSMTGSVKDLAALLFDLETDVNDMGKKFLSDIAPALDNWGTGSYVTGDAMSALGSAAGDVLGGVVGDTLGVALNAALPGVGLILGEVIGHAVDQTVSKIAKSIGDQLDYIVHQSNKNRNDIIKLGFEKIRSDVKDMAEYSYDIYTTATQKIYDAWDQNLSKVTATQGYTKEALNTLQDSVAQRLQNEGYGNVINASEYITQLSNVLNSKISGSIAEAFAAENLILQNAVPEVDLSSMAVEFAAIFTNAQKQGASGEDAMIRAMEQITGATKALEEVTGGNNQFINQIGDFLKKSEEIVSIAGGSADKIADLTTQMMAAEAPLSALTPQLSGFTSTMIDTLVSGNDATAVALRAIMNDINSNVGITETALRQSFMEDTQGTLVTMYQAIDKFISDNSNEAARMEFLNAMTTTFGIQAKELAQVDFKSIAESIQNVNAQTNIKELTKAENLVRSGETATLEEQLVNNTANQLLATNAVRDTIDNRLMRKLEANEINMEKQLAAQQAVQSVNFADQTLSFLINIFDAIRSFLDPFGIMDGISGMLDTTVSAVVDANRYAVTATASQVGSAVADASYANTQTFHNTWGNAVSVIADATLTKSTDAVESMLKNSGVVDTYAEMMSKNQDATEKALEEAVLATVESQRVTTESIQQQQLANEIAQQEEAERAAKQTAFDNKREEAASQLRTQQAAQQALANANYDNIEAIRESVSKLDELSNYLSPILDENRNQSGLLQSLADKVDQLIQTVAAKAVTTTVTSPTPNVNTSYNERDRIYGPIKTW